MPRHAWQLSRGIRVVPMTTRFPICIDPLVIPSRGDGEESGGRCVPPPRFLALCGARNDVSLLHQLHVETETLKLSDQNVERFGETRNLRDLALDDGLVDLRASFDVVRLRGEQLLQG